MHTFPTLIALLFKLAAFKIQMPAPGDLNPYAKG
jgi:hypothetical protein